jgi:hypothetical protein
MWWKEAQRQGYFTGQLYYLSRRGSSTTELNNNGHLVDGALVGAGVTLAQIYLHTVAIIP